MAASRREAPHLGPCSCRCRTHISHPAVTTQRVYAELLEATQDPAEVRKMVELIARAADVATTKLDRFRNVMRFVELRFGSLEPILDVERASEEEQAS